MKWKTDRPSAFRLIVSVAVMLLCSRFHSISLAETPAIIVTVDGLSFSNTILGHLGMPFLVEECDNYVEVALESMNLPVSDDYIVPFSWSRDASESDEVIGDSDEAYGSLRHFLRYYFTKSQQEGSRFIVVSHSWGTFLTYMALYYESTVDVPIICDLYVTLGSPLGTDYAHEGSWPEEVLVNDYVSDRLVELDFDSSTECYPRAVRSVNYWAWGDVISGPLGDYMPLAENVKVDSRSEADGYWHRNVWTTGTWHKYDSLQPGGLPDNQPLKDALKALIEDTIGPDTPPAISHMDVSPRNDSTTPPTVVGTVTVSAEIADDDGIETVSLLVDGWFQPNTPTFIAPSTYHFSWDTDTGAYTDGQTCSVEIMAVDSTGEDNAAAMDVTVNNDGGGSSWPPSISMSYPDEPVSVDDELIVSWTDRDQDSDALITIWADRRGDGTDVAQLRTDPPVLHEDTDGAYGACIVNTALLPDGYSFYVYAEIDDGHTKRKSIDSATGTEYTALVTIDHPNTGTDLAISSMIWDDHNSEADGDGIPEGLERLKLKLELENTSGSQVSNVRGTLESIGSVEFLDDFILYGSIPGGGSSTGSDRYDMRLHFSYHMGCDFQLVLTYEKGGSPYRQIIRFEKVFPCDGCTGPVFEIDHVTYDDSPRGNGDGILQSGEQDIEYYIHMKNTGTANATEVRVWVEDIGWGQGDRNEKYPDLIKGGSSHPPSDGKQFYLQQIPFDISGPVCLDLTVEYGAGDILITYSDALCLDIQPEAWLVTSPREYNFGTTNSAADVAVTITIKNLGNKALTVSGIQFSNPSYMSYSSISLPYVLAGDSSATFDTIINTNDLQGTIEETVTVTTSDGRISESGLNVTTIRGLVSDTSPDTRLTDSSANEEYPDADGSIIAWEDTRGVDRDIYAYDFSAGREFPVCTASGRQVTPKVGGEYVGWRDERNGNWDIYVYDLSQEREIAVATDARDERIIGIDDGKVAFVRDEYTVSNDPPLSNTYGIYNLFYFDISTGITTRVTNHIPSGHSEVFSADPYCEGDFDDGIIAFEQVRFHWPGSYYWSRGIDGIYKYEIGVDSNPVKIRHQTSEAPFTDSGRIVWGGDNDFGALDDYQVWLWDHGSLRQLTNDTDYSHENAKIGSDYVVYEKSGIVGLLYWDLIIDDERVATLSTTIQDDSWRMDESLLVWSDSRNGSLDVYYKYLGVADLGIESADIILSEPNPLEGEAFDAEVIVHNLTNSTITDDITVGLFEGDPDSGGVPIAGSQVIAGGIEGYGEEAVVFSGLTLAPEGTKQVYARLTRTGFDPPANNKAYVEVQVGDTDTDPPVISDVVVEEYNDDEDGYVENDEQFRIAWDLSDTTGIGSVVCKIDGDAKPLDGDYFVIDGPLASGNYSVVIEACDSDLSSECGKWSGELTVHQDVPQVVSVSPPDGATDIPLNSLITVEFDTGLLPTSITSEAFVVTDLSAALPITGDLTYDMETSTITFSPTSLLGYGRIYEITLVAGPIKDTKNDSFESDYVYSFGTIPDINDPTADIGLPDPCSVVCGSVSIIGTATDDNLQSYSLYWGEGSTPDPWIQIGSTVGLQVGYGLLGKWNTYGLNGTYSIKLVVLDHAGNTSESAIKITIDSKMCSPFSLDGDYDVDFDDFSVFAHAWSSEPGDANWNAMCDITPDNKIDALDLLKIVEDWLAGIP